MISRLIAPPYALEYQKNHDSPFFLKPWELSYMMPTVILENALTHPPKVCMGTGRKCHRMDGGSKVST